MKPEIMFRDQGNYNLCCLWWVCMDILEEKALSNYRILLRFSAICLLPFGFPDNKSESFSSRQCILLV